MLLSFFEPIDSFEVNLTVLSEPKLFDMVLKHILFAADLSHYIVDHGRENLYKVSLHIFFP